MYFLGKYTHVFIVFLFLAVSSSAVSAQETLPIYSDYLSDNVFLVHPSAAGIGNCGKIRLTGRNQWSGVADAPSLQTLSFHTRLGYKAGVGAVLFNDKNGYHSQKGVQVAYAYHIELGRIDDINQLSFGMSFMMIQNSLDESSFTIPDPVVIGINDSKNYFNADFSMAYHNQGFSSYFTAKNLLLTPRELYSDKLEPLNLRRYLLSAGYYFGQDGGLQFEPSILYQMAERTGEKFADFNMKVYKNLENAQVWGGLSYRLGFDGNNIEELRYFSPIVGVNYKKMMLSYTYTKQTGDLLFDDGGYHQITLGFNLFCKQPRGAGCPNINASF
jgi:type IX secretion system PorP/SprF family membrane protein